MGGIGMTQAAQSGGGADRFTPIYGGAGGIGVRKVVNVATADTGLPADPSSLATSIPAGVSASIIAQDDRGLLEGIHGAIIDQYPGVEAGHLYHEDPRADHKGDLVDETYLPGGANQLHWTKGTIVEMIGVGEGPGKLRYCPQRIREIVDVLPGGGEGAPDNPQ